MITTILDLNLDPLHTRDYVAPLEYAKPNLLVKNVNRPSFGDNCVLSGSFANEQTDNYSYVGASYV